MAVTANKSARAWTELPHGEGPQMKFLLDGDTVCLRQGPSQCMHVNQKNPRTGDNWLSGSRSVTLSKSPDLFEPQFSHV